VILDGTGTVVNQYDLETKKEAINFDLKHDENLETCVMFFHMQRLCAVTEFVYIIGSSCW
jgi:hypothetical protein